MCENFCLWSRNKEKGFLKCQVKAKKITQNGQVKLTGLRVPGWANCPWCWRGEVCRGPIGGWGILIWPNWFKPVSKCKILGLNTFMESENKRQSSYFWFYIILSGQIQEPAFHCEWICFIAIEGALLINIKSILASFKWILSLLTFCPLTCQPTCSSPFLPPWAPTPKGFQIFQAGNYTCCWPEARIKVASITL